MEIIESEFPNRVERFALLPHSGGTGRCIINPGAADEAACRRAPEASG